MQWRSVALTGLLFAIGVPGYAEPVPIAAWARKPEMAEVRISPDGRYLLYVTVRDGRNAIAVVDRRSSNLRGPAWHVADRAQVIWCQWLSGTLLVCGVREARAWGSSEHPIELSRIAAIDLADRRAEVVFRYGVTRDALEYQLATRNTPDQQSLLVQTVLGEPGPGPGAGERQSVCRLNAVSGACQLVAIATDAMPKYMRFSSDTAGEVLFASGFAGMNRVYWARLGAQAQWQELFRHHALHAAPRPAPFAVIDGTHSAYAIGAGKRYRALYRVDLAGDDPDQLIHEDARGDVREPAFSGDGRLLGVRVDIEHPEVHYLNSRDASVMRGVNRLLPNRFNEIVDVTKDREVYVVRSSSDADAGTYYELDLRAGNGELQRLGAAHPHLDTGSLPRMQTVELPIVAGRQVRAFLSTPLDSAAKGLPLIVLADDGPSGRAEWRFSFLRHFLLSRGYAVLQVQLDETSAAREHWTVRPDLRGAAYAAVEQAARWAVAEGVADARRVGLMGWGFGGYLAVLGSQRAPELFHCAVAVNGVSELSETPGNHPAVEKVIGNIPSWLSRESARAQAKRTAVPLLLIHGSHDAVVHPHQVHRLARALALRGASYERIEIKQGNHELDEPEARAELLEHLEKFFASTLAAKT